MDNVIFRNAQETTIRSGLLCSYRYANCHIGERVKHYNGIGADWFPASLRSLLDFIFPWIEEAVKIHDHDFTFLPKNRNYFREANLRFKMNCRYLIKKRFGWYNPRRYLRLGAINLLYKAVCTESAYTGYSLAYPS